MHRWLIIAGLSLTLALAGCSKDDPAPQNQTPTTQGGDSPTTKSAGATTATLGLNDCIAVATANLGLIGGDAESAAKLKAFNPPSDVSDAIDTLVRTGGLKITGSNQDEAVAASSKVSDWVAAVCPK